MKMNLQTNIYTFNFLLFSSLILWSSEAISPAFIFNPRTVNACATVNCGKGTCRETDSSLFGFECDCYSGWKIFQTDSLTLPPCIIPNCTLNSGCGSGSPSLPTLPRPVLNISDPCSYTWCGDGSCKTSGTSYECDCSTGSDNLHDTKALPCFKECSLGADCQHLGLGTPSPSDSNPSPPAHSSTSHGLRDVTKVSPIKDAWTLLILGALFLPLL